MGIGHCHFHSLHLISQVRSTASENSSIYGVYLLINIISPVAKPRAGLKIARIVNARTTGLEKKKNKKKKKKKKKETIHLIQYKGRKNAIVEWNIAQ